MGGREVTAQQCPFRRPPPHMGEGSRGAPQSDPDMRLRQRALAGCAAVSTSCICRCSDIWRRTSRSTSFPIGVRGTGTVPAPPMPTFEPAGIALSDALREYRQAWFDGTNIACPVYQRERIDVGATLRGPAILDQFDSTTLVCPGQTGDRSTDGKT